MEFLLTTASMRGAWRVVMRQPRAMLLTLRQAVATCAGDRHLRGMVPVLLLIASLASRASAQSPNATVLPQWRHTLAASATRADLESLTKDLQRVASDSSTTPKSRQEYERQVRKLSIRLREGDFQVGDQIKLEIRGDTTLRGTFVVQRGLVLVLPNLPDIKLQGVLRSELHSRVVSEVSEYLRNPAVIVTPLLQVSVGGEVRMPGFYRVAADTPLSDVLMQAGGPTPAANLSGIAVHHAGEEVLPPRAVSDALASGSTLDQLGLRAGDEIVIPQKRSINGTVWLQSVAVLAGLLVTVFSLRNR